MPHFIKVALQTVRTWSKDYTIGLRKFATRPSVGLPLLTSGYNWAKTNTLCKIVQDDNASTTVEVCSQVAQSRKRLAKDAIVLSESSSAITTSSHAQNRRTDVETDGINTVLESLSQSSAVDVTEPSLTKRRLLRKSVTESSSAADVTVPSSTKRGRKRKTVTAPSSESKKRVVATVSSSKSSNRCVGDIVIETLSQSSAAADVTKGKAAAVSESFSQSLAEDTSLAAVENFETYKRTFSKWTVKISKTDALYDSRCNCPAYLKEYLCKHIIGLGMRFKLISVPPEAKSVPIGQKRKRGRPSKTKPALMLQ